MASNSSLNKANKEKNDEFYTQLADIEAELKHYRHHFCGKVVFCNCDDPYESNFFKYFAMNFNYLGLKKLICTCYSGSAITGTELGETYSIFDDVEPSQPMALRNPYKIEITAVEDTNGDGSIDLLDVEYLLRHGKGNLTMLKGNGDFRSPECVELLKEADIVVTNPPFSLFREYVAQLMAYEKKFIILGNMNAITYKEIFPLIKDNQLWLGCHSGAQIFRIPYSLERGNIFIKDGVRYAKFGNICWFTNLETAKRTELLELWKNYDPTYYPCYDNYDAIEVSRISEIPYNYFGVMGVPITFLDKHNPEQFEIVGMAKRGAGDPALKTKVYTKEDYPNYSDLNATPVIIENGKPRNTYPRILIRRKQNGNTPT